MIVAKANTWGGIPTLVAPYTHVGNIVAGVDGVPAATVDAADGMGFSRWRRLLKVELPLATPVIITGIRIATVTTVGLVTVTALIGLGGYGDLINDGLDRQFYTPIIVGGTLSVLVSGEEEARRAAGLLEAQGYSVIVSPAFEDE